MAGHWLGLIELLLVFGVVLGWAGWQWWDWRQWRRRQERQERQERADAQRERPRADPDQ